MPPGLFFTIKEILCIKEAFERKRREKEALKIYKKLIEAYDDYKTLASFYYDRYSDTKFYENELKIIEKVLIDYLNDFRIERAVDFAEKGFQYESLKDFSIIDSFPVHERILEIIDLKLRVISKEGAVK